MFKSIYKTIYENRELISVFAKRDFTVKYRNSILGYFWAVVPPLATVLLFSLLVSRRVFNMGVTELPYLLHALWSLSLWQLFASVILNTQNSLQSSGQLIYKVKFESVCIVIASSIPSLFDFILRLVPISALIIWYSIPLTPAMLLLPIIIAVIYIMSLGIGLLLSCINMVISDLGNLVSIVLTFGMFLSPILYPPPMEGIFSLVNSINPFSPLLIATQQILAGSSPGNLMLLMISIVIAILVFLLGWRTFHIALPKVVE